MDYISDPHQAELNAAKHLRLWGYPDATATTGGADGGLDVRARGALAQVKFKGAVAGRPELQQLVGARGNGSQKLFFFAASGYSAQAIDYADQLNVLLMTYDPLGEVEGVNQAAKRFLATVTEAPATAEPTTDWKLVAILTAILIVVLSVTILLWWP